MEDNKKDGKRIDLIPMFTEPDYINLEESKHITLKDGAVWESHCYGVCIGREDDKGNKTSYFKKDIETENTEILDKIINDPGIELIEKPRTALVGPVELKEFVYYYLPYRVKDHSSLLPTFTDEFVDTCMNVKYKVSCEILFCAGDGLTKYITHEYRTDGPYTSSFYNEIKNLDSTIEEMFDDNLHEMSYDEEDDVYTAEFYNEVGEPISIDVNSINEFMRMLCSVRVINVETTIVDK